MKNDFRKNKERIPLTEISINYIDSLDQYGSLIQEGVHKLKGDEIIRLDEECRASLRNYFKKVHEMLYDIE